MSETKFKGSPVRVAGEFITAGAENFPLSNWLRAIFRPCV